MLTKSYRTRIIYVIIAIVCLVLLFIGTRVLNKKDAKNPIENEEEAITVFNYENKELSCKDSFLLESFACSNSCMELFLKQQKRNLFDIKDYIKQNNIFSFDIKKYIESQFPTAFVLMKDINKNQGGVKKEDSEIVLEDLIIVDDLMEQEKGEILQEEDEAKKLNQKGIPKPQSIESLKVDKNKPYVLIYHTHGTEAFLPVKDNQYHTTDRKYNILLIGDIMSEVLKKNGHKLIHIDTYHDTPSYNKSYYRSLKTITEEMKKEKNLKVVFDVHRDGVAENAEYLGKAISQSKVNINGKSVATFSLVIGPESPNTDKVLRFSKYIKAVSDKMYPGLCKGIIVKPKGKFNQFVSDYYALIEVGSNLNTIEEAKESAKVISEVLDVVINNIQQ